MIPQRILDEWSLDTAPVFLLGFVVVVLVMVLSRLWRRGTDEPLRRQWVVFLAGLLSGGVLGEVLGRWMS